MSPTKGIGRWSSCPRRAQRERARMATEPVAIGLPQGSVPAPPPLPLPANGGDVPVASTLPQRQPFFDDKNRAFWILQSIGWGGYFVLRTLTGIANNFGFAYVIHNVLLTATGYSMTLLMA